MTFSQADMTGEKIANEESPIRQLDTIYKPIPTAATAPNKENQMIVTATATYKLPSPGSVQGVLAEVVDLGLITTEWQGKKRDSHKCLLTFEIDETVEREGTEQRMIVSRRFTASLNEKAALRAFLEGWRGKTFTDEELAGFDLDKIVGTNAILSLVHNTDNGKTYCNIDSAAALLKGMQKLSVSDDYVSFAERTAKRTAAAAGGDSAHHTDPGPYQAADDDIPF
jgi:hypothetical protein